MAYAQTPRLSAFGIEPMQDVSAAPIRRAHAVENQPAPETPPQPAPNFATPRLRLEVLDAVRGLAALGVVLFHIRFLVAPVTLGLSKPFQMLAALTNHGHDAVVVFIVLSGFVLTLPVARQQTLSIPGGLPEYVRRRARRILPPYFGALIIFLLLGWVWFCVSPSLSASGIRAADNPFVSSNATPGAFISHALMVFNVYRPWAMAVDNPMWSVATEWQIYFLFPLILLPLWRHAGLAAAVIGGFAVGLIPVLLLPSGTNFDTWCPWMLGDFAMGMAAASIAFAPPERFVSKGMNLWGVAAAIVVIGIAALQMRFPQLWHAMEEWQKDVITGAAVGLLLVYLARCQVKCARPPLLFRMLDTRLPIALGAFSYSLYLVHFPVISALDIFVGHFSRSAQMHVLAMYIGGTALSLICGYAFYRVFERPFISSRPRPAPIAQARPIPPSHQRELTASLRPF